MFEGKTIKSLNVTELANKWIKYQSRINIKLKQIKYLINKSKKCKNFITFLNSGKEIKLIKLKNKITRKKIKINLRDERKI